MRNALPLFVGGVSRFYKHETKHQQRPKNPSHPLHPFTLVFLNSLSAVSVLSGFLFLPRYSNLVFLTQFTEHSQERLNFSPLYNVERGRG